MPTKLWRLMAQTTLSFLLVVGLAACDSKKERKPVSQVAAQVNSEEISVHQINFVLGRSNVAIAPEQAPAARREVLDKLIDQQLAVEQAIDRKLDRTPETIMAIEAARREILARAYVEQIAARQAKPTPEDEEKYLAEHPQLFAERRIFKVQEIALPASSQVAPVLREMVAAGRSMDDIARWLQGKDIKFSGGSATRPAEQVALDLLPKLHALEDGQSLVLEDEQKVSVIHLVASQRAPIDAATALPRVRQFLGNQRIAEGIASDIGRLRTKAKITYQGEFAKDVVKRPATPERSAAAVASTPREASIEKGIAGIK